MTHLKINIIVKSDGQLTVKVKIFVPNRLGLLFHLVVSASSREDFCAKVSLKFQIVEIIVLVLTRVNPEGKVLIAVDGIQVLSERHHQIDIRNRLRELQNDRF